MSIETERTPTQRIDALEQRMAGLTQAVDALTTSLILKGVARGEDIMGTLSLCETELRRFQEETHASRQVRELIHEVHVRLPVARREWD